VTSPTPQPFDTPKRIPFSYVFCGPRSTDRTLCVEEPGPGRSLLVRIGAILSPVGPTRAVWRIDNREARTVMAAHLGSSRCRASPAKLVSLDDPESKSESTHPMSGVWRLAEPALSRSTQISRGRSATFRPLSDNGRAQSTTSAARPSSNRKRNGADRAGGLLLRRRCPRSAKIAGREAGQSSRPLVGGKT